MVCYLNLRHQIAALVPIPNQPGAYFVKDEPAPPAPSPPPPASSAGAAEVRPYHWQRLDGRYLYFATGRATIAAHVVEMGGKGWQGIAAIEERCAAKHSALEAIEEDPKQRDERRMKRAMGLEDAEECAPCATSPLQNLADHRARRSESLVHLSELYSTSLRRLHAHVVRIYSPAFANLARLPETFRDGTQARMVETLWGRLTDGSAFALVGRMVQSTRDVTAELRKRREQGGDGGEGGGGLGGLGGMGGPPTGV